MFKKLKEFKMRLVEYYKEEENKKVAIFYTVLRFLVILCLIREIFMGNYHNVFLCLLTLILFLIPFFIEDKLKVTTKWSTDNISVDNHSSLQVTKFLDCKEDIDFGTLDSEMYPFVGYARVGHARLLYGITENEEGDIDVEIYSLPLVDVARADSSLLKTLSNSDV